MAGRGWAWTAYDWDEGRLFNYIGDAQNTFRSGTRLRWWPSTSTSTRTSSTTAPTGRPTSMRSSKPRLADRERLGLEVRDSVEVAIETFVHRRRLPRRQPPVRILGRAADAASTSGRSAAATSGRRTSGGASRALRDPGDRARRRQGVRARPRRDTRRRPRGGCACRRRRHARALAADLPPLRQGRQDGRDLRRRASARAARRPDRAHAGSSSSPDAVRLGLVDPRGAASLPLRPYLGEPWPVSSSRARRLGVLLLHRGNLSRLRAGNETRVSSGENRPAPSPGTT